jgi:hypothetical protein
VCNVTFLHPLLQDLDNIDNSQISQVRLSMLKDRVKDMRSTLEHLDFRALDDRGEKTFPYQLPLHTFVRF